MSEHDVIAPRTSPETPPQSQRRGPVLIELEDGASPHPSPSDAPPVPDLEGPLPEGRAMQIAARLAAKPASKVSKFFWRSAAALFTFMLSVAAWRALEALIASNPIIGWIGVGLTALFVLACCVMILRELRGWARLGRLDRVQKEVRSVSDLATARKAVARVEALYAQNPEQAWGLARLRERQGEILDGETLLDLAEAELMGPLDQAARREIAVQPSLIRSSDGRPRPTLSTKLSIQRFCQPGVAMEANHSGSSGLLARTSTDDGVRCTT